MSYFSDKLGTNFIPSDAECDQIREIVSTSIEERSLIHRDLIRMNVTINKLHQQQRKLDKYIQDHRSLLSSIRRFPVELIQKIFCSCLLQRNATMSAKAAPLLLGRVCSSWRKISRATPQLWSSLHLSVPDISHLPNGGSNELQKYGKAVEEWLSLSANTPLSISFVAINNASPDVIAHLLRILILFSHRWKYLAIRLPHSAHLVPLMTMNEHDVPSLQAISMEIMHRSPVEELTSYSLFRPQSLRSLILYDVSGLLSILPVRWERLTKLRIEFPPFGSRTSTNEALDILFRCSNLITCKLDISFTEAPLHTNATITLSSLQTLWITHILSPDLEDIASNCSAFFGLLSLPCLQNFTFRGSNNFREAPFHSILIQGSTVQSLDIETNGISTQHLVEILLCLPLIKRLRLVTTASSLWVPMDHILPAINNNFFTRLASVSTPETPICSQLEEIDIRLSRNSDVTDEVILQFLLARTDSVPPGLARLKRVEIGFGRPRQVDILPSLCHIIKLGLKLRLSYGLIPRVYSPMSGIQVAARHYWDNTFWLDNTFAGWGIWV